MKREILFKYYIENNHTGVIYKKVYSLSQIEEGGLKALFDTENYTIIAKCQFTGLLDKNGNNIFEWDKLKRLNGKIDIVVFDTGRFVIEHEDGSTDYIAVKNGFEITGNIHGK